MNFSFWLTIKLLEILLILKKNQVKKLRLRNGDHTMTMIRTEKGKQSKFNMMWLPRPYSRINLVDKRVCK
jgi:transcription termination factor Rho